MAVFKQRRSSRSPVVIDAQCRAQSGARDFVALVDLSVEGCCVMTRQPFLIEGQRVSLRPVSLERLDASVRWTNGVLAGLQFDRPLYPAVYEHLARTHARPDGLGEGAGYASASGDLPAKVRNSLLSRIRTRAEEAENKEDAAGIAAPYRRLPDTGRRPGLGNRKVEEKLLQLYLG